MIAEGNFIVLEGGEHSGKSTQLSILAGRLRSEGHAVTETFEPGGTKFGGEIRSLLLGYDHDLDPVAEALLIAADRAQHVVEVLRPALDRGDWVLCDRFIPSSLAYQGRARGLGVEVIESVNSWAAGGLEPDLVIVLDLAEDTALGRSQDAPDRLEGQGREFHLAVREGYRELAASKGWRVVDADGSIEEVSSRIWATLVVAIPGAGLGPLG